MGVNKVPQQADLLDLCCLGQAAIYHRSKIHKCLSGIPRKVLIKFLCQLWEVPQDWVTDLYPWEVFKNIRRNWKHAHTLFMSLLSPQSKFPPETLNLVCIKNYFVISPLKWDVQLVQQWKKVTEPSKFICELCVSIVMCKMRNKMRCKTLSQKTVDLIPLFKQTLLWCPHKPWQKIEVHSITFNEVDGF